MNLMKRSLLIVALSLVAVSAGAKKRSADTIAEQIAKARNAEATFEIPAAAALEQDNADLKDILGDSKLVASANAQSAAPVAAPEADAAASAAVVANAAAEAPAVDPLAESAVAPAAVDISKKSENEIPVLATKSKAAKSTTGSVSRILATLGILCVVLIGTTIALKRFARSRQGKTQHTAIKILTQHHIGPKKTLAIVQVAGESILIGVTDHSITMLKSLALLDEEVPGQTPSNFDSMMDIEDEPVRNSPRRSSEREPEDFTLRGLDGIRDSVSKRLRGMKEL